MTNKVPGRQEATLNEVVSRIVENIINNLNAAGIITDDKVVKSLREATERQVSYVHNSILETVNLLDSKINELLMGNDSYENDETSATLKSGVTDRDLKDVIIMVYATLRRTIHVWPHKERRVFDIVESAIRAERYQI